MAPTGAQLNEVFHVECVLSEQPDPVAVTQVEFDGRVVGPFETVHVELRAQELLAGGEAFEVGNAQHEQRAVAEEDQLTTGPQEA